MQIETTLGPVEIPTTVVDSIQNRVFRNPQSEIKRILRTAMEACSLPKSCDDTKYRHAVAEISADAISALS